MAAIQGGAKSVYFGVGKLNMRSRSSNNFSIADLITITGICKEHQVRTYLTLNTIIYDAEIDEMYAIINAAKENGIDAIIASDMAVISYAKSVGMIVHLSTQCNVTNLQALKYYSQFADVIVTARELSLAQVAIITAAIDQQKICGPSGNLIKIEVFVHGALCMAVSGKCYLSLDNFNYSANRGACLQLCRRGYTVTDREEGLQLDIDHEYIMSPKDLCTINFLDKVIKAGVKVLKIEGRGRSPEYVKTVTQCYHEAVNAIGENTFTKEKVEAWSNRLNSVYNRGFWDGYYLGRKTGEWTEEYGSRATKRKVFIGTCQNYFSKLGVAEFKIETKSIAIGDQIIILGPTTGVVELSVSEIRLNLVNVNKGEKGDICSIPVPMLVRRSDKLYKMVDMDSTEK